MPKKIVVHGLEALTKLKAGVDVLANTVKTTLGPSGRNVVIQKTYGSPSVTKDGVSVARAIDLGEGLEGTGAALAKEVASKTGDEAGDGTTTATVLAQAILDEGYKAVSAGMNPVHLRDGILMAAGIIGASVRDHAQKVDDATAERVASISANDEEIGGIIATAFKELGYEHAVITVDESKTVGVHAEIVPGMKLDKGFATPYMANDESAQTATYEDTYVLVTDRKISYVRDLLPIIEKVATTGKKELVIIADDVDNEALSTIVANHLRGGFHALVVKAPSFGDNRKESLRDIAVFTGGKVSSDSTGLRLQEMTLEDLGRATKVVADKESTVIVGGGGAEKDIQDRVSALKAQLEKAESGFDKDRLVTRIAKLSGGIGVIKVGAATDTETKEIRDRVEDAIAATKAAIEEGIVPGGGIALLNACTRLKNALETNNPDVQPGIEIVRKAVFAPLRQIADNAGYNGDVVIAEVMKLPELEGFNAKTGVYEDLMKAGVIDPAKVVRLALENAASIAALLVTTSAVIYDEPQKTDNKM